MLSWWLWFGWHQAVAESVYGVLDALPVGSPEACAIERGFDEAEWSALEDLE